MKFAHPDWPIKKTKNKKSTLLGGHGKARRTVKAVKRCCELLYNYDA